MAVPLYSRCLLLCVTAGLWCAACTSPAPTTAAQTAESPSAPEPPAVQPAPEQPAAEPPETERVAEKQTPAPATVNPHAEAARQVLLPHCGQCHNGALPTSLPRAKAVYDLSEQNWYARIAPQQYDGMLRRVRGHGAITDADKNVIESFVRCARDNVCDDAPN